MNIYPLASSSSGNAYLIDDGTTEILIECGLPINELKKRSIFEVPINIDACLITHEHGDHSRSVEHLLNSAVDCYMLKETAETLGVENHHRTKIIKAGVVFEIGSFTIAPLNMVHDVPCVGFLIVSKETKERLLFATDTSQINYKIHDLDYIMIEANYDNALIEDDFKKDRIIKTHMSIDGVIEFLKRTDLSKVKKIYLMHLSSRNSDEYEFKTSVQEATGKQVVICKE